MKKNLFGVLALVAISVLASCSPSIPTVIKKNSDKPVVFYNRFPSADKDGVNPDTTTLNHNANTFYVGPSAIQGGLMQGQLIVDYYANKTIAEADLDGDGTLRYVQLIGQLGQDASIFRTNGVRKALGTYVEANDTVLNNDGGNTVTKIGTITLRDGTLPVEEINAKEMKDGNRTWSETAADIYFSSTLAADKPRIDFVASNNDGMGMAIYNKHVDQNWKRPIFGFDANTDAVKAINPNSNEAQTKGIAYGGTISQNVEGQTYQILRTARNVIEGVTNNEDGTQTMPSAKTTLTMKDYGVSPATDYSVEVPNVLLDGISRANSEGSTSSSATWYSVEDKSLLTVNKIINASNSTEYENGAPIDTAVKALPADAQTYSVLVTVYSSNDPFPNNQLVPMFQKYADLLKLKLTVLKGDGTSDSSLTNFMNALNTYDAYILNMVNITSGSTYMDLLNR